MEYSRAEHGVQLDGEVVVAGAGRLAFPAGARALLGRRQAGVALQLDQGLLGGVDLAGRLRRGGRAGALANHVERGERVEAGQGAG